MNVEDDDTLDVFTSSGRVWRVELVADEHIDQQCFESGELKPRRGVPQIRLSEFLDLLYVDCNRNYIFPEAINGWGALTGLQLHRVTGKAEPQSFIERTEAMFGKAGELIGLSKGCAQCIWESKSDAPLATSLREQIGPAMPRLCAMMTQPLWSLNGWSADSAGFAFWVSLQEDRSLSVVHGKNMEIAARNDSLTSMPGVSSSSALAVYAHHIVHRYYVPEESIPDRFTYHALVLLEWNHGKFCTVLEMGIRNGLGGYGGKSNWYPDKNAKPTALFAAMPECMKAPWDENYAELRGSDIAARDVQEFKEYLSEYTGERFLDAQVVESLPVRLTYRTQPDIMRYLLNYIRNDDKYSEMASNCQAFVADFFGFLTAKQDARPFHEIHVPVYTNRSHMFLYDPDLE